MTDAWRTARRLLLAVHARIAPVSGWATAARHTAPGGRVKPFHATFVQRSAAVIFISAKLGEGGVKHGGSRTGHRLWSHGWSQARKEQRHARA
jgi:hypothetical protein